MSVGSILRCLAECSPGLHRASAWPGPARRWAVRRWVRAPNPDVVAAALRLARAENRAFCRRVRLEGWDGVAIAKRAIFELVDDGGEALWPVALRAMVLFVGAVPWTAAKNLSISLPERLVIPPGSGVGERIRRLPDLSAAQRFIVRVLSSREPGDVGFRVIVEAAESSPVPSNRDHVIEEMK